MLRARVASLANPATQASTDIEIRGAVCSDHYPSGLCLLITVIKVWLALDGRNLDVAAPSVEDTTYVNVSRLPLNTETEVNPSKQGRYRVWHTFTIISLDDVRAVLTNSYDAYPLPWLRGDGWLPQADSRYSRAAARITALDTRVSTVSPPLYPHAATFIPSVDGWSGDVHVHTRYGEYC